jgi:hypothetical protein
MEQKHIVIGNTIKTNRDGCDIVASQDTFYETSKFGCSVVTLASTTGTISNFRGLIGSQKAIEIISKRVLSLLVYTNIAGKEPSREQLILNKNILVEELKKSILDFLNENPIKIGGRAYNSITSKGNNEVKEYYYEIKNGNKSIEKNIKLETFHEIRKNPLIAFNSKIVCVGICSLGIIIVQIGDFGGNILNNTNINKKMDLTSLLLDLDISNKFEIVFEKIYPKVICLSSEGVKKTLEDANKIYNLGNTLLDNYKKNPNYERCSKLVNNCLNSLNKDLTSNDKSLYYLLNLEN